MQYWLESGLLKKAGFVHGFTMRKGGVSQGDFASWNFSSSVGDDDKAVADNLHLLATRIDTTVGHLHGVHQVHGHRIVEVLTPEQVTTHEKADGLLIRASKTTALVKTADCVPVLVAEQKSGQVAALHAGWRGVQAGIVPKAIERLRELVTGADCLVAIGPHISAGAFQVGPEVAEVFAPFATPDPKAEGKFLVSLVDALLEQLSEVGLGRKHVEVV